MSDNGVDGFRTFMACNTDSIMDSMADDYHRDADRRFEAAEANREVDIDAQIADITNNPHDDDIYEALVTAPDVLQIEFANAYRDGLPLNNIVRKMLKDSATNNVG